MASKSLYAKDLAPSLGCHWIAKPIRMWGLQEAREVIQGMPLQKMLGPWSLPAFPFSSKRARVSGSILPHAPCLGVMPQYRCPAQGTHAASQNLNYRAWESRNETRPHTVKGQQSSFTETAVQAGQRDTAGKERRSRGFHDKRE